MQYSTVTLMAIAAATVSAQNFLPPMPAHAERAELVARKGNADAAATSSGVSAKATATKSAAAASKTASSTTKATATKSGAAASSTVVTAGAAGAHAGSWVTIAGMGITFALFM